MEFKNNTVVQIMLNTDTTGEGKAFLLNGVGTTRYPLGKNEPSIYPVYKNLVDMLHRPTHND